MDVQTPDMPTPTPGSCIVNCNATQAPTRQHPGVQAPRQPTAQQQPAQTQQATQTQQPITTTPPEKTTPTGPPPTVTVTETTAAVPPAPAPTTTAGPASHPGHNTDPPPGAYLIGEATALLAGARRRTGTGAATDATLDQMDQDGEEDYDTAAAPIDLMPGPDTGSSSAYPAPVDPASVLPGQYPGGVLADTPRPTSPLDTTLQLAGHEPGPAQNPLPSEPTQTPTIPACVDPSRLPGQFPDGELATVPRPTPPLDSVLAQLGKEMPELPPDSPGADPAGSSGSSLLDDIGAGLTNPLTLQNTGGGLGLNAITGVARKWGPEVGEETLGKLGWGATGPLAVLGTGAAIRGDIEDNMNPTKAIVSEVAGTAVTLAVTAAFASATGGLGLIGGPILAGALGSITTSVIQHFW
ncbi:hypothetical protein [Tsukamurella soli]